MLRPQVLVLSVGIVLLSHFEATAQVPTISTCEEHTFNIVPYDEGCPYQRTSTSRLEWSDRRKHVHLGGYARSYLSIGVVSCGIQRIKGTERALPSAIATSGVCAKPKSRLKRYVWKRDACL